MLRIFHLVLVKLKVEIMFELWNVGLFQKP